SRVEGLIMCALRLVLMNRNEEKTKRNRRKGSSSDNSTSISTFATKTATDDDDIYLNPEYHNDGNNVFFYAVAANAFDHSPTVREYFHNNRSRITPNNKSLWPLRYQAYKEYGI